MPSAGRRAPRISLLTAMRSSFKASSYCSCRHREGRTTRVPCADNEQANQGVFFGSIDKLCVLAREVGRAVLLLAYLACKDGQATSHLELQTICREHMPPREAVPNRRDSFLSRILDGGKQFFITHQLYSAFSGERAGEMEQFSRQTPSSTEAHYARSDLLGVLPATFVGSVRGADRPGIRYQLELFPHQAFFLRMTYLSGGNNLSFDDMGSWAVESDRRLLVLWRGQEPPLELAIKNGNTLRRLDMQGREVGSLVDYDLRRTEGLQPLEARVAMRGMYRYFGDSGRFTECLTGQSWPVSRESDNAALLVAYSKARRHPGDEVLASLFGRLAARSTREDEERQRTLVVERFMGVWPGETCGAQVSTQSLGNTYWRLTRLGAMQLSEGLQQGEPHLILHSESRRVSGSVGCNRLMGRYELTGGALSFDQIVATRTSCLQGMGLEKAFVEALGQVKRWKIDGHRLELLDAAGRLVACLEARQME